MSRMSATDRLIAELKAERDDLAAEVVALREARERNRTSHPCRRVWLRIREGRGV